MNFFNKFNKLGKIKINYKKIFIVIGIILICVVLVVLNKNKSRAIFKFDGTGTTINSVVSGKVVTFPNEPSSYSLIGTTAGSQTWTAPEDGYFQIEAFGASGAGGTSIFESTSNTTSGYRLASGGGGGGGGYASSRIKMEKGDTIILISGAVGATTSATINSSLESYSQIQITSGVNGTAASKSGFLIYSYSAGTGGAGGTASGGNYLNANGSAGSDGKTASGQSTIGASAGGAAGYTGGNVGGAGGKVSYHGPYNVDPEPGSPGFFKIYRGDTNKVIDDSSSEPTSWTLIGTYTTSDIVIPEDGWFLIELQGASGTGSGAGSSDEGLGGGGGGGGGCAISKVKMSAGDKITCTLAIVPEEFNNDGEYVGDSTVIISSSQGLYDKLTVTGAQNGTSVKAGTGYAGGGGVGGIGSGGNYANYTGGTGGGGEKASGYASGGRGGSAGYTGGNKGGDGGAYNSSGSSSSTIYRDGELGYSAFVKVYRENTN